MYINLKNKNLLSLKKFLPQLLLFCLFSGGLFAYGMDECISCHSDNPGEDIPQMSAMDYQSSIHGSMMECSECHSYIEEGHEAGDISETVNCSDCHDQENMHGASSGKENQPRCYSCHTKHNILPSNIEKSSVNEKQFKKLCVECHKVQYGESGYLKWFTSLRIRSHKKQDFSKKYNEKNCVGCHQKIEMHEKKQKLSEDNCSKCHMKDNKNAMMGRFHSAINSGTSITGLSIITQLLILVVFILAVHFIIKPLSKSGKGEE